MPSERKIILPSSSTKRSSFARSRSYCGDTSQKLRKTCLPNSDLETIFFDCDRQELRFRNKSQRLTEKESEVLWLLCRNKNRILKGEEAVEAIYGKSDYFLGRNFDVFISRMRKLLRRDERINIENVFRVGFILNVAEEVDA